MTLCAAQKSVKYTKKLYKDFGRKYNQVWSDKVAKCAPMFTHKIPVKLSKDEKKKLSNMNSDQVKKYMQAKEKECKTRHTRLISKNTFSVASGAASHAVRLALERDAARLRVTGKTEHVTAPFQCTITSGAQMLLQNWIVAYVQEAGRVAADMRMSLGNTKRLNGDLMKMGFENANERIFSPLAPRAIFDATVKRKPIVAETMEEKEAVKEMPPKERPTALRKMRASKRATEKAAAEKARVA